MGAGCSQVRRGAHQIPELKTQKTSALLFALAFSVLEHGSVEHYRQARAFIGSDKIGVAVGGGADTLSWHEIIKIKLAKVNRMR